MEGLGLARRVVPGGGLRDLEACPMAGHDRLAMSRAAKPRYLSSLERRKYAERLALQRLSQVDPKVVAKYGEANLLSDIEHEILMSLPGKVLVSASRKT